MPAPLPLQGTPGVLDPRNPTLLPNTDTPVASGTGTLDLNSPAAFDAANPRVAATATATIAGTVALNDSLTLTITHGSFTGGSLSKTILAATGDTVSNLAEKFCNAFNQDAQCEAFGITLTALLGVITVNWPGPLGNVAVLSRVIGVGAETITFAPVGGAMSGGSGPIYPYDNFQEYYNGSVINFRAGQPYFADFPLLQQLISEQQPII
jgi:hypothetical protein